MACLECGNDEPPAPKRILLDDILDDSHPDVDLSVQEHAQLECRDCGVILGYQAIGAAVGSQDTYGYY